MNDLGSPAPVARTVKMEVLSETTGPALKSSFDTWRGNNRSARVLAAEFAADGTNFTVMILYAEG